MSRIAVDVETFLRLWRDSIPLEHGRSEEWIEVSAALKAVLALKEERREAHSKGAAVSSATRRQTADQWRKVALALAKRHCSTMKTPSAAARTVVRKMTEAGIEPPKLDTIRKYLAENVDFWHRGCSMPK